MPCLYAFYSFYASQGLGIKHVETLHGNVSTHFRKISLLKTGTKG